MIDSSGLFPHEEEKTLHLFALGETLERNMPVGGVFFTGNTVEEYERIMTSKFIDGFIKIYKDMLEKGLGTAKGKDNKKLREEWRERLVSLSEEFIKFLKGMEDGKDKDTNMKLPKRRLHNKDKNTAVEEKESTFRVYIAKQSRNGELNLYYLDRNLADNLSNILDMRKNEEIDEVGYKEELGRLSYDTTP